MRRRRIRSPYAFLLMTLAVLTSVGPVRAEGVSTSSPTIAMSDGVKLAADVALPAEPTQARHPSILVMSPYGRASRLSAGAIRAFTSAGLAVVLVDVRGSGASQGHATTIFSAKERGDIGAVLAWIASQPWSDGRVVATGASYDGNLAALAVVTHSKALAAAVPRFIDFDTYRDLAVPGGVRNEMLLRKWGALTDTLNLGTPCLKAASACAALTNLKPVDGDTTYESLRAALRDHRRNWSAYRDTRGYAFEDDVLPSGASLGDGFLSAQFAALKTTKAPVQIWGSWFDAATADSALEWYRRAPEAKIELYLGAWTHGGGARADPFVHDPVEDEPGAPVPAREFLGFVQRALASPSGAERIIHYYTAGVATWRTTRDWPPANIRPVRWYFSGGGGLAHVAPTGAGGADRYIVDFSATTGKTNRWTTQLGGGPVDYGDRGGPDRKLLTYTSTPLDRDLEITGGPVVGLRLASTTTDGAVFAYLEAVAPDGRSIYLSEGDLRLALRGPARADNRPPGVSPSFQRADRAALVPGAVIEAGIPLHAVSAMVPKGYRLRIAIGGADADTFARYPTHGEATYTIWRTPAAPSYVDLPQADWRAGPASGR
jgi:putative CocE/NonD family hydrolase